MPTRPFVCTETLEGQAFCLPLARKGRCQGGHKGRCQGGHKGRCQGGHKGRPYSYLSASIGSSREARIAGSMPKTTPTAEEKPIPMANGFQFSEVGRPVRAVAA